MESRLYIKRITAHDSPRYILRETYRDDGNWKYRDLLDLGADPGKFLEYPGGTSFYLSYELQDALESAGVAVDLTSLEEVFAPFLHPHLRWAYERSGGRLFPYNFSRACPSEEVPRYQEDLHPFDVRRLHYLKFGHIDMGRVDANRPWKYLKVLSCKCRDEIEAVFDAMEAELKAMEFCTYIYTSLHLQSHFPHHILRDYPVGLDIEELDAFFTEEICRLNQDDRFFNGLDRTDRDVLHPYLVKYVWLYFDHDFLGESPWERYERIFRHGRRSKAPPAAESSISVRDALAIFQLSQEKFSAMSGGELKRLYRRKAKKMHPDKGGDHNAFVRLARAYEVLAESKK